MASTGRYRVLPGETDTRRFLDRESYEPVVVSAEGPPEAVSPGNLVEASLDWSTPEPTVDALSVVRPTRYTFYDGVDPVFEAAEETWRNARAAGDGMNSRVTHNTDGEVNGVVYVFADDGDRFGEFSEGLRPLEPLVDRVNDRDGAAPRDVFVLRPVGGEFVVVTIALRKDGRFARTMRDTYG